MATLKTKFSVGLFLICGLTVVVVGVVWLGMSNILEEGNYYVCYFDESVQGLDKDSPVKYRGVSIGRVHAIGVAPDGSLIEVTLKIDSDIKPSDSSEDYVAQLKSVGITGLMFIEIEQKGAEPADVSPPFTFTPPYPVVLTRASEISKIFKGIEDVFNMFRALDADTLSSELTQALHKINASIDEAQLAELAGDVRATLKTMQTVMQAQRVERLIDTFAQTSDRIDAVAQNADGGITEVRQTVARLGQVLDTGAQDMQHMTADLKAAAFEVKRAMQNATILLENTNQQVGAMQQQVKGTINRVDQAAETLNRFLNHIGNHPSQIIFSAPSVDKPRAPKP